MFCHLMQNKFLGIDGELEKDRFNGLETRELNDTEIFTSPALLEKRKVITYFIIKRAIFKRQYLFWRDMARNRPEALTKNFLTTFL